MREISVPHLLVAHLLASVLPTAAAPQAQQPLPAGGRDFLLDTQSVLVRRLDDRRVPSLEEASKLTTQINAWLHSPSENGTFYFPAGRYYVTAGFPLGNGTRIFGANERTGMGKALRVQDRTIFVLHPDAPSRAALRSQKRLDALAKVESFTALFHARRSARESARDIAIQGITIDLGAPRYPAPLERNPEDAAVPSGIRLENASSCTVTEVHILNAYLAGISVSSGTPGADLDYGRHPPCATNAFHKVTRAQYRQEDSSCKVAFLSFKNNNISFNLIDNYWHAVSHDPSNVRLKLFSPPHIVGIEVSSPPENEGKKLQSSADRVPDFPSFSAASTIGLNTIRGNRIMGGEYGISIVDSVLNTIDSNYTAMSAHRGISLQRGADYNVVSGNHVTGHGGSGIHVANDADGNDVVHNTVEGAGFLTDDNGQLVLDRAGWISLLDGEGDGIKVYVNSNENKITKNVIRNCRASGIRVGHHAVGTEITENQISFDASVMGALIALNRSVLRGAVRERVLLLPIGIRLGAVFDEQRQAGILFGAEYYPPGHPLAGYEKVQSSAELSGTVVSHNTIVGVARGIVLGDDSVKHLPAQSARVLEAGLRPSIHENTITDNKIAINPSTLDFLGFAADGSRAAPNAGAPADAFAWIGAFSFNDGRGPDGQWLACDPTLRMTRDLISRNWDIDRQPTPLDSDEKKVNPRLH